MVAEETFGGIWNTTGSDQILHVRSRATTFGGQGKGRAVVAKSEGGAERKVAMAEAEQGGGGLAVIRQGRGRVVARADRPGAWGWGRGEGRAVAKKCL
jgi:hypothetical protein